MISVAEAPLELALLPHAAAIQGSREAALQAEVDPECLIEFGN
jgi:hypothetical protein